VVAFPVADRGQRKGFKMLQQSRFGPHGPHMEADGIRSPPEAQQGGAPGAGADQFAHPREGQPPAVVPRHRHQTGGTAILLSVLFDPCVTRHALQPGTPSSRHAMNLSPQPASTVMRKLALDSQAAQQH
jgi:hypothetical protein